MMSFRIRRIVMLLLPAFLVGSSTLMTAPATATPEQTFTKNVRITKYHETINRTCPKDSVKVFLIKARIKRGVAGNFKGNSAQIGEIVLRSDRQLNAEGYLLPNRRRVEFLFDAGPKAKVKQDPAENSLTLQVSTRAAMRNLRVSELNWDCMEAGM